MVDFTRLDSSLLNDDLVKGFKIKSAAEVSAAKVREIEKEEEAQAFRKEFSLEANRERMGETKFEDRINNLFADFDRSLPTDFTKYGSPKLDEPLAATKNNIRNLAADMYKLSELAGGDPKLEQSAEKITANLLDRLKSDLGLSAEERKKLEGKSLEEIQEYYAQTRSDGLKKLDETVSGYRKEIGQLIEQSAGKSVEEKAVIYRDKLDEIAIKAGNRERIADLPTLKATKGEDVTINDVRVAAINSQTASEQDLAKKQAEKSQIEAAF